MALCGNGTSIIRSRASTRSRSTRLLRASECLLPRAHTRPQAISLRALALTVASRLFSPFARCVGMCVRVSVCVYVCGEREECVFVDCVDSLIPLPWPGWWLLQVWKSHRGSKFLFPDMSCSTAHPPETETSALAFGPDDNTLISRGGDQTMKVPCVGIVR